MKEKRKIKGKEFLKDLRAGMTSHQLMEKYLLSPPDLRRVVEHLNAAGALVETEVTIALGGNGQAERKSRQQRRCYPAFFIPVYDLGDLLAEGQLHDISEKGMRASGIDAQPGAEKELIVEADGFAGIFPFCIKAVCRWIKEEADGSAMCGFEITNWPPVGPEELKKIIQVLTICDRE